MDDDDRGLSAKSVDGMYYYVLKYGLDHHHEIINNVIIRVAHEIKAERGLKRKSADSIQRGIDIKKRTRAAKAARKKRGIDNDSPFLTAIRNMTEFKETIEKSRELVQQPKELTDALRAEIHIVKNRSKNGNGK